MLELALRRRSRFHLICILKKMGLPFSWPSNRLWFARVTRAHVSGLNNIVHVPQCPHCSRCTGINEALLIYEVLFWSECPMMDECQDSVMMGTRVARSTFMLVIALVSRPSV